nr:MAG TPA: hypothetical protein [Bacteriophage sp.]
MNGIEAVKAYSLLGATLSMPWLFIFVGVFGT